ncbi:hypothetical protein Tco_1148862 [Tanacetum coccineum]
MDEAVEITNVFIPVNVNDELEEITDEKVGVNKGREKGERLVIVWNKSMKRNEVTSTSGNQELVDDYIFGTDSYASDDDEIPTKQVSQDYYGRKFHDINESKVKEKWLMRC